ncbi:hypothetical protein EBB59_11530 [Lysobacter pythonis]|uniref:Uncharacterized protein n=1 Tax=Solilutibacter pythonis TaxID=2483112 RepID=A0A3M2HM08_9GAMM|nr:hypothetical protein EBB59_11530 [Lysobacter pythonis]
MPLSIPTKNGPPPPYLAVMAPQARQRKRDLRPMFNAPLNARAKAHWCLIPHEFPPLQAT